MTKPPSNALHKSDARRLMNYSSRMHDSSLTTKERAAARKNRNALMLSLYRAGWSFSSIAAVDGAGLSVVRERILSLPATTKSMQVRNMKGEKVTPEPLAEEFEFGTLEDEEVEFLRPIAALASLANFTHSEDSPEYKASRLLDVTLAHLYDHKKRRTLDMARAINASNTLVRLRLRRARGKNQNTKGIYEYPDSIKKDVESMMQAFS